MALTPTESTGEIVFTSTTEIIIQSPMHTAPFAYGSFVLAGNNHMPCVGIIYNVETTSLDPGRKPMALGLSDEELLRLRPHSPACYARKPMRC